MVIESENNNNILLKLDNDELETFLSHKKVKEMFPSYKIKNENDRFAILMENGNIISGDDEIDGYALNE